MSRVTVITATTGNDRLRACLQSVHFQTHPNVQHLIFVDGERPEAELEIAKAKSNGVKVDVIQLPYSVGKDRWNGHRMYAAGSYLAQGDYVMFLDDDNALKPEHIQTCLEAIEGNDWVFSFRNIVEGSKGDFICQDNCESLGMWASCLHPEDYFVDVNCFFLRRQLAVGISPLWFRKFREPGQPEIDRVLTFALRNNNLKFAPTYKYTVNYAVGNTKNSVQRKFFEDGNAEMLRRYDNKLPWVV